MILINRIAYVLALVGLWSIFSPSRPVVEEKIKLVERVVVKEVVKHQIVTKVVTKPDGTVSRTRIVSDRSSVAKDISVSADKVTVTPVNTVAGPLFLLGAATLCNLSTCTTNLSLFLPIVSRVYLGPVVETNFQFSQINKLGLGLTIVW